MAKRNREDRSTDPAPVNNPFAGLANLKASLPKGPDDAPPVESSSPSGIFAPKVVLRVERKGRGGKTVTLVQGVIVRGAEREKLVKEIARALGVRVFDEDGDVVVAGDQRERLLPWLNERGAKKVVS